MSLTARFIPGRRNVVADQLSYQGLVIKATGEQQNMGQAQCPSNKVPYRPGILRYQLPMPLSAHARPREARQWLRTVVS